MNSERDFLSYSNNLYTIVEESLDAALNVCNNDLELFTESKIFDVFDQTFPTAYVLSTGYWIFFVGNRGTPLCVCGRFGLICRHIRSKYHWIDLQPIDNKNCGIVFNPKLYGPVVPLKYNIDVQYAEDNRGYVINLTMELGYLNMPKKKYHTHIQARYGSVYSRFGPAYSIRFTPNPVNKAHYGKYFTQLKQHRSLYYPKQGLADLIVTPINMPPSCLYLRSVNVAKFELPTAIFAVLLSDCPNRKTFKNSATQTPAIDEVEQYRYLLGGVASSVWKYDGYSGAISYNFNDVASSNEHMVHQLYPVRSDQYPYQLPVTTQRTMICKRQKMPTSNISIPQAFSPASGPNQPIANREPQLDVLPNFEETFCNSSAMVPAQIVPKRKRGRPKNYASSSYFKNQNPLVKIDLRLYPVRELPRQMVSVEVKELKEVPDATENLIIKPNFLSLDDILSQTKQKYHLESEDLDSELDIINQLIAEEAEKDKMREFE